MFRVLTISREFGSGGGDIARLAAARLGWKLLDNALIEEIARTAQVEPELARRFDERVDSWLHRVARGALWHGGLEGVAAVDSSTFLDAQTITALARNLILEAERQGECVVVGRGAQCILQGHEDVFHIHVYAPWEERVRRVRDRLPETADPEALIRSTDACRAEYVRQNYGFEWQNPHLYHLLISSSMGEDAAVDAVLAAMGRTA